MKLDSLKITNFMSVRDFTLDLNGGDALITGRNAAGKSTIASAYYWTVSGRDVANSASFEVKTLAEDGSALPELEHSVAVAFVGGPTLKRTYRERWSRKRGSAHKELVGHETTYEVDGVKVAKNDYEARVAGLVGGADLRLLSDPFAFNQALKWQERREILLSLVEVDDSTLATPALTAALGERSPADARKVLEGERRDLKRALDALPVRINEAKRALVDAPDVAAAEAALAALPTDGDGLEAYEAASEALRRLNTEQDAKRREHEHAVSLARREYDEANGQAGAAKREVERLRADYRAVGEACGACGQPLASDKVDARREEIAALGGEAAQQLKLATATAEKARAKLEAALIAHDAAKAEGLALISAAQAEADAAREAWGQVKQATGQRAEAERALEAARAAEKAQARVDALMAEEKEVAAKYEAVEAGLFAIEEFGRARVRLVEDAINGRFATVRFKLFAEQLNDGVAETCLTTVNGVPYDNLNTAAKVQAGLEIIAVLQAHHGVSVPVFVDGAESVLTLPEMNCQLVRLAVADTDLTVAHVA